jgi:ABC-type nitrate/sulfonate/bicarbonate transport system substrate-binding protein
MTMPRDVASLRLIAFPGAPNLPIFAGLANDSFARQGLALSLETTPSSVYQIENLHSGQFDIAATAFDNVVAYREGQGAIDLGDDSDLFVFMGATRIELSLIAAPTIENVAGLEGQTIALDALATGFAFVLYDMLERAGLGLEACDLAAIGATPQRWEAVRTGAAAATLTIEPFTSIARAQGFRVLATSTQALPNYQGGIFAARGQFLAEQADAVERFVRGYLEGLAWTLDPANMSAATALLLERMPAIRPGVVAAVMGKLMDPRTGLTPGGQIDRDGMATVLALRSRYGEPHKELTSIDPYLDLGCYERAIVV